MKIKQAFGEFNEFQQYEMNTSVRFGLSYKFVALKV